MSILDKVVAAVTPPESEESRRKARAKAKAASQGDDWLAQILHHHELIEGAFTAVRAAADRASRQVALQELGILLSAHANAEEAVIYPALIHFGHKTHGTAGYTEQAGAKANLGELEYLDPTSQDFMDKLEHIRGAVAHHVYEEENDRFLDLKKLSAEAQERLTQRYTEEFERFSGGNLTQPSRLGTKDKPALWSTPH
jgi:hemerythrin superfamily protein